MRIPEVPEGSKRFKKTEEHRDGEKEKIPHPPQPGTPHGHNEMSLEEIAKVLGISRERVRQIEMQAIRKIRSPLVSRRLRDYLEE